MILNLPFLRNYCLKKQGFLILLAMFMLPGSIYATDYYVSTTGSDLKNGLTVANALLTINSAIGKASTGDVIYVLAGTYRENADVRKNGITIRPYNNDAVIINGCDLVTGWTLASGTTYKAQFTSTNLTQQYGSNQVFSDGKMMELTRWPDQTSANLAMPTNAFAESVTASGTDIVIDDADFNQPASLWVGAKIWINLSRNGRDGQGFTGTVTAVNGTKITVNYVNGSGSPAVIGDHPWGLGPNTEYFLFNPTPAGMASLGNINNVINDVLSPGEWWRDGSNLYVKTLDETAPSLTGTGANVVEAKARYFGFYSSNGSNSYTIKNFTLFGCAISTEPTILQSNWNYNENVYDVMIDNINFLYPSHITDFAGNYQLQHYAWSGIVLAGLNNTIQNCTIKYASASALSLTGKNLKVLNNTIDQANYLNSNAGAVNTGYNCQDSEIGYNTITNTPGIGINIRYARNANPNIKGKFRIHHNTIRDFMLRSGDSGAIDNFGSDLKWLRVDHNIIYNTNVQKTTNGVVGLYFDYADGSKNIRITLDHNVIYNVTRGILINPGKQAEIFNNTIITNVPTSYPVFVASDVSGFSGILVYNNIMDNVVGRANYGPYGTPFSEIDVRNNITNATGSLLGTLFVDATNPDYKLRNYALKATALDAIDKGISVGVYDDGVMGVPDLGAIEFGTNTPSDTQAPALPNLSSSGLTNTAFHVTFSSTDNVAVVSYDLFVNGLLYRNYPPNATTITLTDLTPSTIYKIKVVGIDATGNRSPEAILDVKTLLPNGVVNTGDITPPTVPTNLIQFSSNPYGGLVKWDVSTDNEALAGYQVFKDGNYFQTVTTNSVILRGLYPNTSTNIQVRAKDNMGNVSALTPVLAFITRPLNGDIRYEAENASFGGSPIVPIRQNNVAGASNGLFISKLRSVGAYMEFSINALQAGPTDIMFRYVLRNLQTGQYMVKVNGVTAPPVQFTYAPSEWDYVSMNVVLNLGLNTIRFEVGPANDGDVELDYISLNYNPIAIVPGTLPVTLTKYTALVVSKGVKVDWLTQSESNNQYFKIERSADGNTFEEIATVNSKGSLGAAYSIIDPDPLQGVSYYRLSQYDTDGKMEYLGVKSVNTKLSVNNISFYPNPVVDGALNISLGDKGNGEKFTVNVSDLAGRNVYTNRLVDNGSVQSINIGLVPTGIYTISINSASFNYSSKLMVK